MGIPQPFTPAKLVIGALLSPGTDRGPVLEALRFRFGEIGYVSGAIPFDFTRYYENEMGSPLTRYFFVPRSHYDPSRLAEIKRTSNEIEEAFAVNGRRTVNLDPGMLNESNFVLATTKPFSHRVPLSDGIYAEVTLIYQNGAYRAQPWTYPDYASEEYGEVLQTVRDLYRAER